VISDASLSSRLYVASDVTINKRLFTSGDASFNGNLFVISDASLSSRLYVASDVTINKRLIVSGTVTSTSFNATSDYRIKANVDVLNNTYVVDYLKPVTYYNTHINKQDIGFIAHEVQEQFPFLVNGIKDDTEYQTLNYTGFIGILTKEIQELKKEIKEIKQEVEEIRSELASYKQ
jgi:hypothetical protein